MKQTLVIKNMVCDRCIESVAHILADQKIKLVSIELGKAVIEQNKNVNLPAINLLLKEKGFELISDEKKSLVEKVKNLVVLFIRDLPNKAYHDRIKFITERTGFNERKIKTAFKEETGKTLDQFVQLHRIERAKELLSYGEHSISQIANILDYNSVQYFSSQFKKLTGISPAAMQKSNKYNRKPLSKI